MSKTILQMQMTTEALKAGKVLEPFLDMEMRHYGKVYKDGQPCKHHGCSSHISHPCEGCGRIGARGEVEIPNNYE